MATSLGIQTQASMVFPTSVVSTVSMDPRLLYGAANMEWETYAFVPLKFSELSCGLPFPFSFLSPTTECHLIRLSGVLSDVNLVAGQPRSTRRCNLRVSTVGGGSFGTKLHHQCICCSMSMEFDFGGVSGSGKSLR